MRGRNTMRFSAPTREPPGGRPSRGAKLKGRGCTRQKDARNENRLGGTGAAKKAPSEQGATKAAGLGAEDARLEPRQWSAAERVSRDRRRKRRCCARAATEKSARQLSIFFLLPLVIPLRTPRQAQEAATQGTPISPSVFYWVGSAVGHQPFLKVKVLSLQRMKQRTYIAIDLKSFYASVECVERGLDPLTTRLVVADESRTDKTICLAVSPALKAYGISGRARLFEVKKTLNE